MFRNRCVALALVVTGLLLGTARQGVADGLPDPLRLEQILMWYGFHQSQAPWIDRPDAPGLDTPERDSTWAGDPNADVPPGGVTGSTLYQQTWRHGPLVGKDEGDPNIDGPDVDADASVMVRTVARGEPRRTEMVIPTITGDVPEEGFPVVARALKGISDRLARSFQEAIEETRRTKRGAQRTVDGVRVEIERTRGTWNWRLRNLAPAVPTLMAALEDGNTVFEVAEELGQIGLPALKALTSAATNADAPATVRGGAVIALGSIPCDEAAAALKKALSDRDERVRSAARKSLEALARRAR